MSEWRSKCCRAKIQPGRPDNEKWECSKCHKLCEYEYPGKNITEVKTRKRVA